jgi:CheY-like chemotaxis protein
MKKILIVDDSVVVRRKLLRLLSAPDTEVVEACDGQVGLQMVDSHAPDIILLDSNMPNLDGLGMLAQLRQTGNSTPVLLVTAEANSSAISSLVSLGGVVDYIMKPFNPDSVRAQVRKFLSLPNAKAAPKEPATDALRILTYCSNPDIATELQLVISQQTELYHCSDASTAIATCRKQVFTVIFIDVSIPSAEIEEAHSLMQELQRSADFVALINSQDPKATQLAIEHGFHRCLSLPLEKSMVAGLLARYARKFAPDVEKEKKQRIQVEKEPAKEEQVQDKDQETPPEAPEAEVEASTKPVSPKEGALGDNKEAEPGIEGRREDRYVCEKISVRWRRPGLLTALKSGWKKAEVVDVGFSGLCVELREQLTKEKPIYFELVFPGQKPIKMDGMVRYSFLVEERRWSVRYRTGIQFHDVHKDKKQLGILKQYLLDNLGGSVQIKRRSVLIS